MPLTYTRVSTEAQLNADIQQMDTSAPVNWGTITLAANIALSTALLALDLGSAGSVSIIGQGDTISDAGAYSGLSVTAGNVTLSNLTIANASQAGLSVNGGTVTMDGTLAQGGGLTLTAGTVTLSGVDNATATTAVDGGTLILDGGSLNPAANLYVNGTFDLNGQVQTVAGLSGDIVYGGVISLGDGTLIAGTSGNSVSDSSMSGTGSLIKVGTGTLTLAGNDNTFTGGTTIEAGTLLLGLDDYWNSSLAGPITNDGVLAIDDGDVVTLSQPISGTGGLVLEGTGTIALAGMDTFSGGVTIQAGMLDVAAGAVPGSGPVSFGTVVGATLRLEQGATLGNTILGFGLGDTIDLAGIGLATSAAIGAGNTLTISGGSSTVALQLDPSQNLAGETFALVPDGNGGTDVALASIAVSTEAQLNAALAAIDLNAAANIAYTIEFANNITLDSDLWAINLSAGQSLAIIGNGYTLDAAEATRGFFAYQGNVSIQNLTIANARAVGGAGGGGGAGLGGGLFIAAAGTVALQGVTFSDDWALGGSGGMGIDGGGGLGGNGGWYGGGGGIGSGAFGSNIPFRSVPYAPGAGIVLGYPAYGGGGGASYNFVGALIGGSSGGVGGFGGDGGAAWQYVTGSSNGGFGGGGGALYEVPLYGGTRAGGGLGGFGAGNGAGGGDGGFGGGGGGFMLWTNYHSGGGGLGAGGAIFVQYGGSLTFGAGSEYGGAVYGGGSAGFYGSPGSAFGAGLFIQGNQQITLAPPTGQTLTIADPIADQTGSTGYTGDATSPDGDPFAGAGSVLIDGGGTVIFTAANTYVGGTTIEAGTLLLGDGGSLLGDVIDNAMLAVDQSGSISLGNAISGTGGLIQQGAGVTALTGLDTFSGGVALNAGTLEIGTGGSIGSGTIDFTSPNASLQIDASTAPSNIISQFRAGDTIDLHGIAYQSDDTPSYNPTTGELDILQGTGTVASLFFGAGNTLVGDPFHVAQESSGTGIVVTNDVPCFLRGTRILTDRGKTPVEVLTVGDRVITLSGEARPIVWIGTGQARITPMNRTAATPIIVRKGALANDTPGADLYVTKGHSLFLDGVLIPAEFLVNHRSILWDDRVGVVRYYHIELPEHDVLFANGAAAESYRDDGNRALFDNANSGWDQPAKPPCAPVLTGGPLVDAIWRRLLDRAGPRPELPLTDDPDLHLLVDGHRRELLRRPDGWHAFDLPSGAAEVRLVSRAASPAELGLARDPRVLGAALRQMCIWQGARVEFVAADDQSLAMGFHDYEPECHWRWTNGDGRLPVGPDARCRGVEVLLQIGGHTRYVADADVRYGMAG